MKKKENDVHSPKCPDNSICSVYVRRTSRACHVHPVRTEIVEVRGQAERDSDRIERTRRKVSTVAMMEMVHWECNNIFVIELYTNSSIENEY